jgi:hypothetical protein
MKMSEKIITEGEYSFDFSESLNAYKADNKTRAGLKSVDFIVETEKTFLLYNEYHRLYLWF